MVGLPACLVVATSALLKADFPVHIAEELLYGADPGMLYSKRRYTLP